MSGPKQLAAILIDFENIYYYLRPSMYDSQDVSDVIASLVQRLRRHLMENYNEEAISLDAYADFERISESAQGALYLIGVETHNVLGTDHKNAADMKLCIDALATLYTRQEIRSFIVVAGDRDYIPVIQHLKKHGRTVRVVGFPASVSGDLLTNVGEENFLDASQFLPDRRPGPAGMVPGLPIPLAPEGSIQPGANGNGNAAGTVTREAQSTKQLDPDQGVALNIMLKHFHGKPEVWMTPYLHKLRSELPHLSEYQRKALIAQMAENGVIQVEKRKGDPHDFSVILLNWNHPDVRSLNAS